MLPACVDMPVKFAENICREEKIFKHAVGRLKEIVLSEDMAAAVAGTLPAASGQGNDEAGHSLAVGPADGSDAEIILPGLPEALVIEVTEGHAEPHLYVLKPESLLWYRDKFKQAPVR